MNMYMYNLNRATLVATLLLVLQGSFSSAQTCINFTNPSFEGGTPGYSGANPTVPPNWIGCDSPDLYPTRCNVKTATDGSQYVGLVATNNKQEYISQDLASPLVVGQKYYFYIDVANYILKTAASCSGMEAYNAGGTLVVMGSTKTGGGPIPSDCSGTTLGSIVLTTADSLWVTHCIEFTAAAAYTRITFASSNCTGCGSWTPYFNVVIDNLHCGPPCGSPTLNLTASADPDTICKGQSTTLKAVGSSGTAPYNYTWSTGSSGVDDTLETVSPLVTTTYTVTVTDATPLTATKTITVVVSDPVATISPATSSICAGSSATLTASVTGGLTPYSYTWSPAGGASATATVTPTSATTYTVSVSDKAGCTATSTAGITIGQLTVTTSANPASICVGSSATLSASASGGTPTYNYVWTPSTDLDNAAIQSPVSTPTATGTPTYTVTVTDANTCTGTATVSFIVQGSTPVPVASATDSIICPAKADSFAVLSPGAVGTYLWSPPDGLSCTTCANPVAKPTQTTVYTVVVTSTCGSASASDDVEIKVQCDIKIPNVFSPNADNINDKFVIVNIEQFPNILTIYDRWGLKVFEASPYKNEWEGKHYKSGAELSEGTYYYVLTVTAEGKDTKYSGFLTLIRAKK